MKAQTITKGSIIEAYSDYILPYGERTKNFLPTFYRFKHHRARIL